MERFTINQVKTLAKALASSVPSLGRSGLEGVEFQQWRDCCGVIGACIAANSPTFLGAPVVTVELFIKQVRRYVDEGT